MSEPTLDEQIAAVRDEAEAASQIGAATRAELLRAAATCLEAQRPLMALAAACLDAQANGAPLPEAVDAATLDLDAQRLPLLADPAHPPSADDAREAHYRRGHGHWCDPDCVACFFKFRLDATHLALSGAQKEVALRDAEIARGKSDLEMARQRRAKLLAERDTEIRHLSVENARLNAVVNTPPGAGAMEIAYNVIVAIQEACPITEGVEEDQQIIARAIEAAEARGRERAAVEIESTPGMFRSEHMAARVRALPDRETG